MKKENFKLDDDTIARIEAFAKANNLTKSSAIRLLLARALGQEIEDAYIAEVVNKLQTIVRGNVGKMLARWEKELVTLLSSTLEVSAEEVVAEIPPVTDIEREIVRARSPGQKPGAAAPLRPAPASEREERMVPEGPALEPDEGEEGDEGEDDDLEPLGVTEEPATKDVEIADAEALYWENYKTMLDEIGATEETKAVADEAGRIVSRYNPEAVAAGWAPPIWGSEDFAARKAKAFPQGGVRGRR